MENTELFGNGSFKQVDYRVKLIKKANEKILAVTDLHLGIELEFLRHGVSTQGISQETITNLLDIIHLSDPARVVFLGDTKHSLGITKFEKKLLETLVNEIDQKSDIELIFGQGNHDPNIEKFLPSKRFSVFSGKGIILKADEGRIGLAHGHQIPRFQDVDEIILGHVHPSVYLQEFPSKSQYASLQSFYRFPVLLTGSISLSDLMTTYNPKKHSIPQNGDQSRMIRIQILPGFNKILSSSGIGSKYSFHPSKRLRKRFLDRLFALVDFEVNLIEGTYLGFLSDLNQEMNQK
ncbi:MAG: metallophosphoesterase [Promethearchaeota archaeon]